VLAIAAVVLLSVTVRAQDAASGTSRVLTKQGSAAFIFTMSGLENFDIGAPPINGLTAGVGAKYYISDDMALRLLLAFSSVGTAGSGNDSAKVFTNSRFGIGAGVEMHMRPFHSISPYVGAQVTFATASNEGQSI